MTLRPTSRQRCAKPETVGVYYQGQTLTLYRRGKKQWTEPDHFMPAEEAIKLFHEHKATFIRRATCIIRFDVTSPKERKTYHFGAWKIRDVSSSPGERLMDRYVDATHFRTRDALAVAAIDIGWGRIL
jgi:hypothetical protein